MSAAIHPAGYAGECESCQEHGELFHAQHDEDRGRLPPPLPFCRPCADFALDQLHAEQAEIDRLEAEDLLDEATAEAFLIEIGVREPRQDTEALAQWVDAADRHDRERTDAYAAELRAEALLDLDERRQDTDAATFRQDDAP